MHCTPTTRLRLLTLLAAVALLAAACGDSAGGGEGAESGVASEVDLSEAEVTVGSKSFTEQLILGQIALQALEAAGASVTDQIGLVGTNVVREALESGEIDMYWEYTGTAWINILGNTDPVPGAQEQWEAVAEADVANDLTWLPPAPGNNTYALAAGPSAPEDVTTISDYADLVASDPEAASLCTAAEFVDRSDGLPGLEEHYGFDLPDSAVTQLDFGLVYTSAGQGDPCQFAAVFATDGRVLTQDLRILEDDQAFFPQYNVALVIRDEVYEAAPEAYDALFGPISEALTDEALTTLNAAVDVEGESPEDVARQFLVDSGIVGE